VQNIREKSNTGRESELLRFLISDKSKEKLLIDAISPIVRFRVARTISRRLRKRPYFISSEDVDEIAQEVMALLFASNSRLLHAWDSCRGLSFNNYVGLVAERSASRILRVRLRRGEGGLDTVPGCVSDSEVEDSVPGPEDVFATREYSQIVVRRILNQLSPFGGELFELLVIKDRAVEDVCELMSLSREATYTWRSRLAKLARRVAKEVDGEERIRVGVQS
jgi:DNA-directed RNA polymerase specialized sigma24 family protein